MKDHGYFAISFKCRSLNANRFFHRDRNHGFTLLELLLVLILIGGLAAIAVPSWLSFLNTWKLNKSQSQVLEVMRKAQATAKNQRIDYHVGFRQQNNRAQWATYPASANPANQVWHNLEEGIRIDSGTTLFQTDNVYRVEFNHNGAVSGWQPLGRVTLSLESGGAVKRCVIVSSVLGAIRTGENQPKRQGNPCD